MACCDRKPSDVIRCQDCNDSAMEIDSISALILRFYSSIQRMHRGTDHELWDSVKNFEFRRRSEMIKYIAPLHGAENSAVYRRITRLLQLELLQRDREADGCKNNFAITVKGDNGYLINRYHVHGIKVEYPVVMINLAM